MRELQSKISGSFFMEYGVMNEWTNKFIYEVHSPLRPSTINQDKMKIERKNQARIITQLQY